LSKSRQPNPLDPTSVPEDELQEKSLKVKIKSAGKKLGSEFLLRVLTLYYVWQKPSTPAWAKRTILAALAYFIWPLDSIPDFFPGGFVDDWAALGVAIAMIAKHIDQDCVQAAEKRMRDWNLTVRKQT
jgi:uncharacterized membrane protein YkvA (DUF1232 family)